jgi:diguanylate cyclase (GGDEF)-like protein
MTQAMSTTETTMQLLSAVDAATYNLFPELSEETEAGEDQGCNLVRFEPAELLTNLALAKHAAVIVLDDSLGEEGTLELLGALSGTPVLFLSDNYALAARALREAWLWLPKQNLQLSVVLAALESLQEQKKKVQRRQQEEVRFRTAFTQLMEKMTGQLDESFYQSLLEHAVTTIPGAQAGSLLYRGDEDLFKFVATVGFDHEALQKVSYAADEVWLDVGDFKPQIVLGHTRPDPNSERSRYLASVGRTEEIRVTLSIPIVRNERVIAIFCLDNFEDESAFDDWALEMAMLYARQARTLIERFDLEATLHRNRSELYYLAYHDPLTQLLNRNGFVKRLQQLASEPEFEKGYLVLLDVHNFKSVNDSWGYAMGDALLEQIALRLRGALTKEDIAGRWNGNEFLIFFRNRTFSTEELSSYINTIFDQPFELGSRTVPVTFCGGTASASHASMSPDVLLTYADIALHHAKHQGEGSLCEFAFNMMRDLHIKQRLEKDFREALAKRQITLAYQPVIDVKTGRVAKLEALARWHHPERGPISPTVFIELAEENGMILELGNQVLEMVCQQMATWRKAGLEIKVALNVSAQQLAQPDLSQRIKGALAHYSIPPHFLELELTETTAMQNVEASVVQLKSLRDIGLEIAIDDFGVAYSSLAYLKRLPIDTIKIDRSFISGISTDPFDTPRDANIIRAITSMAQSLSLYVVAEGVETEEQFRFLQFLGCHFVQGYYFSKPLPAAELESWLSKRSVRKTLA